MAILLPELFVDVSTMREIPDTQECWADAGVCVCACACAREQACRRHKVGERDREREGGREGDRKGGSWDVG